MIHERWGIRAGLPLLAAGLLILLAFGTAAAQSGTARVRVIHASPDAPAVDVYVDGQRAISNLAFPKGIDYTPLPAGPHRVQVAPAGAGVGAAVITANLTLEAGKDYTVAAIGPLAGIEAQVFNDDNSAPASGQAKVRVLHLSPDAPAVDIAVRGGPTLVSNLSFPNASSYAQAPAGTYTVEVRPAGTQTAALTIPNVTLEAGKIYDLGAAGLLGGKPELQVVDYSSPAPRGGPSTGGLPLEWVGLIALGSAVALLTLGAGLRLRARGVRAS